MQVAIHIVKVLKRDNCKYQWVHAQINEDEDEHEDENEHEDVDEDEDEEDKHNSHDKKIFLPLESRDIRRIHFLIIFSPSNKAVIPDVNMISLYIVVYCSVRVQLRATQVPMQKFEAFVICQ